MTPANGRNLAKRFRMFSKRLKPGQQTGTHGLSLNGYGDGNLDPSTRDFVFIFTILGSFSGVFRSCGLCGQKIDINSDLDVFGKVVSLNLF